MKPIRTVLLAALLAGLSLGAHADKININEADAAALAALNGVGPARAEAIVEHRRMHGPFRTVDALADVRGISLNLVERNRDRLTVGNAAPEPRRAAPD
jgi:competence protein ComEA